MPVYEYQCRECGVRFERLQRFADDPLTECPECHGHVYRVMQPVGVIFKGSGFYVTDNKGRSSTGIPGKKREDEAKPVSSTDSGAAATSTPSTTESKQSD